MIRPILLVGLFTAIINLIGCSSQPKETGPSKKSQEVLDKSFDAFNNRPIHKVLTEKIIDSTSDENLLQAVFDNLTEKLTDDYEKEFETVMSWNKSRQAIYTIWLLESEVNNGGFNQFYFNSSGQFYKELPGALTHIGGIKFAALTRQANEIFEKENKKITKHQDGSAEGFSKSYKNNPLNRFDEEFYKLYRIENLQQIQVDFIRRNKADFIDK